jgi:hypothetical protein
MLRQQGVAVVFERKVALRNKLRVISYLQTQNDGFWTANPKIRGVQLFELSKVGGCGLGVPVEVGFEWTSIFLREKCPFLGLWRGTVIEVQMGQATALYCRA